MAVVLEEVTEEVTEAKSLVEVIPEEALVEPAVSVFVNLLTRNSYRTFSMYGIT